MSRRRRRHLAPAQPALELVHITCPTSAYSQDEVHPADTIGVDDNGCLTRLTHLAGGPVLIHYDDIPESDMQTVRGMRVTTPLRTVIDLAAQMGDDELTRLVDDFMARGLFSREEALERTNQPDIADRLGAQVLRRLLLEGRP